MRSGTKKRRQGDQQPPSRRDEKKPRREQSARTGSFYRAGAWLAGVLTLMPATALDAWLTDLWKDLRREFLPGREHPVSAELYRTGTAPEWLKPENNSRAGGVKTP